MKRALTIRPPARGPAFTLIEVVLAMLAGAIILVAVYGLFSKAIHLRDDATERVRASRARTRTLQMIRNDLRNAFVSGGTIAASLEGSAEAHESAFPGYIKFTTTTGKDPLVGEVGADVQEVQYFIMTDPNDAKAGVLARTANRVLLSPTAAEPTPVPLLPGVASMDVLFFDGQNWLATWQVTDANDDVPVAIRIVIHPAAAVAGANPPPPLEVTVPWTTQPQAGTTDDPATPASSPST